MYITIGSNYADVNISFGFYYDPDYGYVAVETPTPFRVFDTDIWPSSGVMVATGTGNTKARLTSISNTQCQIDAALDEQNNLRFLKIMKEFAKNTQFLIQLILL